MDALQRSKLRSEVVRIATSNLGYGETEGQNAGCFIRALGGIDGREWCAVFAGYCYRRAYESCGYEPPEWLYRRRFVPEPGAKRLVKNLGGQGSIWKPHQCDASRPMAGDLVAWNRGILGWTGHVGIVINVGPSTFYSIEGNVGSPGRVRTRMHDFADPTLYRFASIEPETRS